MKLWTNELIGLPLDWAVATCEGYKNLHQLPGQLPDEPALVMISPREATYGPIRVEMCYLEYSNEWELAGPIIEREEIFLAKSITGGWTGSIFLQDKGYHWLMHSAPTPLIAAMRCYVASKLGAEIDYPGVD